MFQLLVIDDTGLRREAFTAAATILKKIDDLESKIESFHARDQRLYNNWHELTFREERSAIEALNEEYQKLAHFHNWIIAISELESMSLHEALHYLRLEESQYRSGTPDVRAKIEQLRKERDEYIQSQINDEYGSGHSHGSGQQGSGTHKSEETAESVDVAAMDEDEIREHMSDPSDALKLLMSSLELAKGPESGHEFLRVWHLTPPKIQKQFAKLFNQVFGMPLQLLLKAMKEAMARAKERVEEQSDRSEGGDEPYDVTPGASSSRGGLSAEQERFKLLYRKLVRKLHPDLRAAEGSEQISLWQNRAWHRVQKAYKSSDVREMEKLFLLVLIRLESLHDLTMSEIKESQQWLKEELSTVEREAKGLKRMPAWGFSARKNYRGLAAKARREFDRTRQKVSEQISDLHSQHDELEYMYVPEVEQAHRRASRRPSGGSSRRRSRGRSKRGAHAW